MRSLLVIASLLLLTTFVLSKSFNSQVEEKGTLSLDENGDKDIDLRGIEEDNDEDDPTLETDIEKRENELDKNDDLDNEASENTIDKRGWRYVYRTRCFWYWRRVCGRGRCRYYPRRLCLRFRYKVRT